MPYSARATAITRDISVFIAADMRPFSVVENLGFRRLLHILVYLFYLYCLSFFLCSICSKGLHFSCEIVQGEASR